MRQRRPVRRQLRGLRRGLFAHRPQEPEERGLRRHAGAARFRALLLRAGPVPELSRRLAGPGIRGAGTGARQAARMVRRRPQGLGHLPRRTLLRLPDPRRARQVLLRLAGRADWLHGELPRALRQAGPGLRQLLERRQCGGTAPLHRQGHRQLPWPVLAGDAARLRPPHAHRPARQRLSDGQWREDEQVARHLHPRAHLPQPSESRIPALLLRRQAGQHAGRPRPRPQGFPGAHQQRHRRQVRQPRQPLRGVHREAVRRPAGGRYWRVRKFVSGHSGQYRVARALRSWRVRRRSPQRHDPLRQCQRTASTRHSVEAGQ